MVAASVGETAMEHKEAIGGAVLGAAMAGPLGGLVGGVIGQASRPCPVHAEAEPSVFVTHPRTTLPCLGGGICAAGMLVTGPFGAICAGAVAAAGTYFTSLGREEKEQIIRDAPHIARHAVATVSLEARRFSNAMNSLWTPRIRSEGQERAGGPDGMQPANAKAAAALEEDGFALHPLSTTTDFQTLTILQAVLTFTDPRQLGKGKDVLLGGSYNGLALATAWRIEHPKSQRQYESALESVTEDMASLDARGALKGDEHLEGMPTRIVTESEGLAAASGRPLVGSANETHLLHGTSADVLLSVLSKGLNERYSGSNAGTAFGDGVYLAEDVGKTDQYTRVDRRFDRNNALHQRLYGKHHEHPGDVYYVLVCRVALGYPARTTECGKSAKHMKTRMPLFPVSFRELADIPNITPPKTYHSLIAELGGNLGRFREFIIFHGDRCVPEYLVAYHRCKDGKPQRQGK